MNAVKYAASAVIAAGAIAISGCIVEGGYERSGWPIDATFSLSWEVVDPMMQQTIDCGLAGADTVEVRAFNVDTGVEYRDLFDCHDGFGVTFPVTTGYYSVRVVLADCITSSCSSEIVITDSGAASTYPMFSEGVRDLGHFVFEVPIYWQL